MYDPSMRVLTVLEILQAKGWVTAAELVARLEVSTRTVQRYIARLQDLGIPVTSTRGRGAEYRLRPSFRMPPLLFNNEEAFAVALGLNALQHIGLTALAPAVVGVETKLERTLPVDIWQRTQALSAALHLEKVRWRTAVDSTLITKIASAIEAQQELEMQYQNYKGVISQRTIQPLALIRNEGIWFLAAYCLWRQDNRLFRVDRVQAAHMTQTTFEAPTHFDSEDFTNQRLQNVPARWTTEVWLETTLATLRYDLLPPRANVKEENGGVLLRCNVNDLATYAARLLELNSQLEVRSPPELMLAFKELAERAMTVFEQHQSTRNI